MSLQVWLPLNGDLTNQGLSDITFSNEDTTNLVIDSSGKIGKCYKRTTAKTSGRIISSSTIDLSGDISMCCWAYVSGTVGDTANGLITNHSHSDNTGVGITVKQISTTDYRISCNTGTGTSRTYYSYYGKTNIKDAWHHLALTYNKENKKLQLWVDGVVEYNLSNYTNASKADKIILFDWSTTLNSGTYRPAVKLNDVRIYDHCLSQKEVKEISKGLVLHYRLVGPGGTNLVSSMSAGGQTTVDGNYSIHTSLTSADTYFYANTSESLIAGDIVTVSCDVSGLPNDSCTWNFPFYSQSSGLTWNLKNGHCVGTFTVPSACTGSTKFIFDDNGTSGFIRGVSQVYITNFKIERGSVATSWCPNSADTLYSALGYNNNIEYDCSSYNNNGIKIGNITSSINTPKYSTSEFLNSSNVSSYGDFTSPQYIHGKLSLIAPEKISVSWWNNLSETYSGSIFCLSAKSQEDPTDYTVSAIHSYDNGFRFNTTSGTSVKPNSALEYNKWIYYVLTYDGVSAKVYKNGELLSTSNLSGQLGNFSDIYIGYDKAGGCYRKVVGYYSDFRIYATALSQEDILELYHSSALIDNNGNNYSYEYVEG